MTAIALPALPAPASPIPNSPIAGTGIDLGAQDSFASLLDQSTGEDAESTPMTGQVVPPEEPARFAEEAEIPVESTISTLLAMFSAPPIPQPVPPVPEEATGDEPTLLCETAPGEPVPSTTTTITPEEHGQPSPIAAKRELSPSAPVATEAQPPVQANAQKASPVELPAKKILEANTDPSQAAAVLPPSPSVIAQDSIPGRAAVPNPVAPEPTVAARPLRTLDPPSPAPEPVPDYAAAPPPQGFVPPTLPAQPVVAAAPTAARALDSALSSPILDTRNAAPVPTPVLDNARLLSLAPTAAIETTGLVPVEALTARGVVPDGMTAAKPSIDMSASPLPFQIEPDPVPETESAPAEAPAPLALAGKAFANSEQSPSTFTSDERPTGDEQPRTSVQTPATITGAVSAAFPAPQTSNVAPIAATEVAQVVERTMLAAERLQVTGQERVEVTVKLESGHELVIQLRVANGEVIPLIRTESEPLRQALEQNWAMFSQRGNDRQLRVNTPVFESPQTSSNMADHQQQQRDGRPRTFHEPAPEYRQPQTPRPKVSGLTSLTPARTTGVRLYA